MLKKSRKYSLLWLVVLMAALLIAAGCGGQDAEPVVVSGSRCSEIGFLFSYYRT